MNAQNGLSASLTPVRPGYGFDESRLAQWMSLHVAGYEGPLSVTQFKGGQSNPTYKISTPEKSYVLRRKPPGALLKGAHAIEREARVVEALGRSNFPVAHVLAVCVDDAVIGTWFYIMELVEGRTFWDATFPEVSRESRADYFDAMNEVLARLHRVDYAAVGLADFGKPGNYFQRQIARWSKQYLEDIDAGRDQNMDRLIEWLPAHIPPSVAASIVHGDFRCDNLIFHPTEPKVLAVIDWELSTIGHPLADFTYHTLMYHMPPHIVAGLAGADLHALGIPSESAYVSAYCQRVGIAEIPDYEFYLAFNFFRLAAIFHGIRGRVVRGTAVSEDARAKVDSFATLAKLACEHIA